MAENIGITKQKKMLYLLYFCTRTADSLIHNKKSPERKRGCIPENVLLLHAPVKQRKKGEHRPSLEIHYDMVDYLLLHNETAAPTHCKYPECKGCSRIKYRKCDVHLCLSKEKTVTMHFIQSNF